MERKGTQFEHLVKIYFFHVSLFFGLREFAKEIACPGKEKTQNVGVIKWNCWFSLCPDSKRMLNRLLVMEREDTSIGYDMKTGLLCFSSPMLQKEETLLAQEIADADPYVK